MRSWVEASAGQARTAMAGALNRVRPLGRAFGASPPAFGTLPAWLLEFESSYDWPTGGWHGDAGIDYGSVELEVGRLWHSMVLLLRPRLVLETGTFKGYSTSCIAAGLASLGGDRMVYTIDPAPLGQMWVGTSLAPYVTSIAAMSQDAVGHFDGMTFDLLVLDSDHHYDTIIEEIILYEPMLAEGGAMLLHDSLYFDGVGAAVAQLMENPRFQVVTFDSPRHHEHNSLRSPGVTLVRKDTAAGPPITFDERFRGWCVGRANTQPFLRRDHAGPRGRVRRRPGAE